MAREKGPPIPNPCTSTKLIDETKGADGAGHNWCANDDDDDILGAVAHSRVIVDRGLGVGWGGLQALGEH